MKTQLLKVLSAVVMLLSPILQFAQAPPLGTAANFVLFSSVGAVSNVGTYKYLTHLTGNVGTNSGSSTNFGNVNGVMHDGDGASLLCASDLLLAYNTLSAAIPDSTLGSVIGNGTTIRPGIFLMPGATSLNLDLTLNAKGNPNAVFIFKTPVAVAYAFTANPNSKIKLINGAQACNVFWQVSGAVNVGAGAKIRGSIIAHGAITMGAQDTLEGRALTVNGAITVSNGALGFLAYTPIGCNSPILIGPAAPVFVGLGSYAVFGTTGSVSDCGTSHIMGDVGGNTSAPTGFNFVTGTIHFNDPSTHDAAADLLLIYNNLLALAYDIKLMDPAEFGHNLVLTPHTYQMDAAVTFTDTLYLDAQGNPDAVFIIKTFGAFASTPGSKVILINGTQAKNVYWFFSAAVSIGSNSIFRGAVIAHDAIDILTGASLIGRAYSTNGAISTCGMSVTLPSLISSGPGDKTACIGSSVSFSINTSAPVLTYQWRKGNSNLINGGNIAGATTATLTINPVNLSDAGVNYNVVITGSLILNDTSRNATLTVNPLPAAAAGANRGICINSSTTLGALPVIGSTYSWTSVPLGFTSIIANPTVTPLVNTTYKVIETNTATGCTNNNSVIITINPLPAAVAGTNRVICLNSSTTIGAVAIPGSTYSWTSVPVGFTSTLANPSVTPLLATAYTVIETVTVTGCFNSHSVVVTLNPLPAAIAGANRTTCSNTATSLGAAQVTGSTYSWTSVPAGFTSIMANPTVSPLVSTIYTVVETITATGCMNSNIVLVMVNPLPGAIAGADRSICLITSTTLGAPPVPGNTYFWSSVPIELTSTESNPTVTPLITTNYTLVETITATSCSNSHNVVVTVNSRPVPTISGINNLCSNSGYFNYTTEANQNGYLWTVSSGGTITYGQGTSQIQVMWYNAGAQFVTLNYNNSFGCQAEIPTTFNVIVNAPPEAAGTITGTVTVCPGDMGVLYAVGIIPNAYTYIWNLPVGATISSGFGTNSIGVDYDFNSSSGTITVNGNNLCGDGTPSTPFSVTVNPIPATPTITANGYVLTSSAATGNQWYHDGPAIFGATGQTYTAPITAPGYYWTIVTELNCSSFESNHLYIQGVGIGENAIRKFNIYPVPNDGYFIASITYSVETSFNISIYNELGVMIYQKKNILVNGTVDQPIDMRFAPSGVYTVVFSNSENNFISKILVNK